MIAASEPRRGVPSTTSPERDSGFAIPSAPTAPFAGNEECISVAAFERLASVLERASGIALKQEKRAMVTARLTRRARDRGFPNVESYANTFERFGEEELEFVIDALTTHHTYFFRESEHFDALTKQIGPTVLDAARGARPLRMLSVACSTGEEPTSAAMVLEALVRSRARGEQFEVTGIDVSHHAVQRARRGIYEADQARDIPPEFRARHLERSVQRPHLMRVADGLRARMKYQVGNLLSLDVPPADVVFCRNVLIYFSDEQRQRAVQQLWRALRPGGFLVLGLTESLRSLPPGASPVGRSAYQKKGTDPSGGAP